MKLTEKYNKTLVKEAMEVPPNKVVMGVVESLKKDKWSKDNKSQSEACDKMMKLAEMDDEDANDFMGYMDNASSKYKGNIEKQSEAQLDEATLKYDVMLKDKRESGKYESFTLIVKTDKKSKKDHEDYGRDARDVVEDIVNYRNYSIESVKGR
jgi:hypothetical protein